MELLAEIFHYAWSFVVILSAIVFVHEFGHYAVAKLCGVKVEVFSIGFGREVFGCYDRSGTRWKFSLLPFGGYVKMFGDSGEASTPDNDAISRMSEAEKAVSFHHKPLWKKACVVAAGPAANFLLSIGILTYFIYSSGVFSTDPVIGTVMPDTPAMSAGLMQGDRVLSVDGKKVSKFGDIAREILPNLGTPIALEVQRGEEILRLSITPIAFEEKDALGNTIKRPLIGIQSQQLTREDVHFLQAVGIATKQTYELCETSLIFMGQMISGDRSASELKGPVGIAQLSGQVTKQGETLSQTLHMILWFIALLSVNLGLVNLFPIPMLDGGHLAYYLVEAVRGKPMARKFQEFGFKLGFALVVSLMAFTLFNDLRQLIL